MRTKKLTTIAVFIVFLLAIVESSIAQTRKPVPVPSAPHEMRLTGTRGMLYCEVWLAAPSDNGGVRVVYYNTYGQNNSANKMDTCPAAMWEKVSVDSLKGKYEILTAFKNGPRGFVMDYGTIPAGPVIDFDGVKARWMGQALLPKEAMDKGFSGGLPAYKPLQSHRKSSMTFVKGKPVFIIDDPEGTPFVMQAFGKIVDPTLTYDTLKDLGGKLKLPAGWKFRVAVLDKDLTISTPQGYNWITQDDLQNTYDGCKDGACSFQP